MEDIADLVAQDIRNSLFGGSVGFGSGQNESWECTEASISGQNYPYKSFKQQKYGGYSVESWNPAKGLEIKGIDKNMYVFILHYEVDKEDSLWEKAVES